MFEDVGTWLEGGTERQTVTKIMIGGQTGLDSTVIKVASVHLLLNLFFLSSNFYWCCESRIWRWKALTVNCEAEYNDILTAHIHANYMKTDTVT